MEHAGADKLSATLLNLTLAKSMLLKIGWSLEQTKLKCLFLRESKVKAAVIRPYSKCGFT